MKKLLKLLEKDCTLSRDQLAAATGMTRDAVDAAIDQLERDKVILGYRTLVDWERVQPEAVTALIQLNVTPQSIDGYDRIAEHIYQYEEVESMYLMSGSYDMAILVSGRTLREVSEFVGSRLAPLEGVNGTSTHFILKRYKEQHVTVPKRKEKEERFVFE